MRTKTPPEPPRLKCQNCDGKKWVPSAIGEIACEFCKGTGKGKVDMVRLIAEWQQMKMGQAEARTIVAAKLNNPTQPQ